MKKIGLLLFLVGYTFSFAQENYKYVIVPKKFRFLSEDNKYNVNFLTKSFFEKEGFEVFYDTDAIPSNLANNRCSVLFVDAVENNTVFVTKINIEIKDCYNKVLYISQQGTSREKDYDKAYNVTFREALSSLKGKLAFKLPTEILVELNKSLPVVEVKTSNNLSMTTIANSKDKNLDSKNKNMVFTLQKTSVENVFIAKTPTFQGVVIKKNNDYYLEYYENDQLVSEKVNVKF